MPVSLFRTAPEYLALTPTDRLVIGIAEDPKPVLAIDAADMTRHYETNTLGPLFLFQTFHPLLLKSTKPEKKFIITSTMAGSIGGAIPWPVTAYGHSKAAVNFIAVHAHMEHGEKDKIAIVPVHPGTYFCTFLVFFSACSCHPY